MRILQVSARDVAGGAERSARSLAKAYRELGHEAWQVVGEKLTEDPSVIVLPNDEYRNGLVRMIDSIRADKHTALTSIRGAGRLTSLLRALAEPARTLSSELGREDFDFPASRRLLDLVPATPDIVHLHNLHGGYFDLRILPALSREVPTVLNVRDGWLMSGHCAFGMECERWKSGCGECPDLGRFPAVKRDATAYNWRRKREILAASRLYVTAPSAWMMDRVRESIIAPAAVSSKVIPNGVDTSIFRPTGKAEAREYAGVDGGARLLLVASNGIRRNVWKDYATLRAALEILGSRRWPWPVIVLAIGEESSGSEMIGSVQLRYTPYVGDSHALARLYSAADVYVHAARVESFGNVLLEARACGTPVVATAVGGIPEQIRDLRQFPSTEASGILVPPGDAAAFADAIAQVLENEPLRSELALGGLRHVETEFTLDLQAHRFIDWYQTILINGRREDSR